MRFAIDRLDKISQIVDNHAEEYLRVVDYKTGSVHVEADSMKSVFEGDLKGKNLLQLWLYANLFDALPDKNLRKDAPRTLLDLFGSNLPHQPLMLELYDVNTLRKGYHTYPKIEKEEQKVHSNVNEEIRENLKAALVEVFDPEEPLNPTCELTACPYC